MDSLHQRERASVKARTWVAEAGRVAVLAVCSVAAFAAAFEWKSPGTAAAVVAPEALVISFGIALAAASLGRPVTDGSVFARYAYAAAAVVASYLAASAARSAFENMNGRFFLSFGAGIAIVLLFLAARIQAAE